MPVLDGLDELPASERVAAIRRLNSSLGPADPLIVTCRTREYEGIIAEAEPLTAAATVEIGAVAAGDVTAYLSAAILPRAREAWDAVLVDEGAAALAGALDRPLVLWLLRKTYLETARDPGELLAAVVEGPEAVHARLLDGLVIALYEPGGRSIWPEEQARSWFGFLARHLTRLGTHDLTWWQLHRALPRHCAPLVLGTVGAATVLTTFLLVGDSSFLPRIQWVRIRLARSSSAAASAGPSSWDTCGGVGLPLASLRARWARRAWSVGVVLVEEVGDELQPLVGALQHR